MSEAQTVDLPDEALGKKKVEKKPRLKKVTLDKEDVNRHAYCERAIRLSMEKFQEEINDLNERATEAELDSRQIQMQVQAEHGVSMAKAHEQGKLDEDTRKNYSRREAEHIERLKKVNFAMQNSPQKKRLRAWKKLLLDIEEEVAAKIGCNADDIDWKNGTAEVIDGFNFASMKDEMDAAFEKELERIEAESAKPEPAQESAA